jgi:hypothetical protein
MTINWQDKRHIFTSLNAATSRSHSVSGPALFFFNDAIFISLRPIEGFSRHECNGVALCRLKLSENLLAALVLEFSPRPHELLDM